MSEERTPSAKALVEELIRLFEATDFAKIRDSLEGRLGREESDAVLGPFSTFAREAVHPEIVIDMRSAGNAPADYGSTVFHGFRGWLEFWRLWFEPWQDQRSTNEMEEVDHDHVLQHAVVHNVGRGSGAEVRWEGWNVWWARDGRLVRLEQYATRELALAAAQRDAAGD